MYHVACLDEKRGQALTLRLASRDSLVRKWTCRIERTISGYYEHFRVLKRVPVPQVVKPLP